MECSVQALVGSRRTLFRRGVRPTQTPDHCVDGPLDRRPSYSVVQACGAGGDADDSWTVWTPRSRLVVPETALLHILPCEIDFTH